MALLCTVKSVEATKMLLNRPLLHYTAPKMDGWFLDDLDPGKYILFKPQTSFSIVDMVWMKIMIMGDWTWVSLACPPV